jgi:hypothetical protein
LFGVIDSKGKTIIEPIYNQLTELENNFAMAIKDDNYGYLNLNGAIVIEIKIPYTKGAINWGLFNKKGYARIMSDDKFGLIDTSGNKFVPALFEDIGAVSSKLIAIKRHGKWGYCDYDTKLKIPYNFDYVSGFINDLAFVKKDEKFGLFNTKGSFVIEAKYESMNWFYNQILLVKENGLYGLIDLKQKSILPIEYTKIEFTSENKFLKLHSDNGFEYKTFQSVFVE